MTSTYRACAVADAPPSPTRVFARRIARIAFGAVLLIGAFAAVVEVVMEPRYHRLHLPNAAQILGGAWCAAVVAGAIAYAFAAALRLRLEPRALFLPSLIVPVAAATLTLPLTLHLLVGLGSRGGSDWFDGWVGLSIVISGPAHVAFVGLSVRRAYRLAIGAPAMAPLRVLGITVVVSCVPFALVLIPPVLVGLTGLPILLLLHAMEGVVARERAEIAALPGTLPRALALPPRRAG